MRSLRPGTSGIRQAVSRMGGPGPIRRGPAQRMRGKTYH